LVMRVADWPHSTFHRYAKLGVYPENWGGRMDSAPAFGFGE
jgi:putative transposase